MIVLSSDLILLLFQVNSNLYKLYRAQLDDESSWKLPVENIHKGLQIFEDDLAKRDIQFFGGNASVTDFNLLSN